MLRCKKTRQSRDKPIRYWYKVITIYRSDQPASDCQRSAMKGPEPAQK